MARIYQRGAKGTWWIDYIFERKRYRESLHVTSRSAAEAKLVAAKETLGRGEKPSVGLNMILAALRNLVAAAGPFKIALEHQPDGARGKECMYFTGHDPTVADLVIIAAAVTAAKEVLK